MIKVTVYKKDELINKVTIKGHSNFAPKGEDIVCAGVSAIGVGIVNALNEITKVQPEYKAQEGDFEVKFLETKESQLIARVMLAQLLTIEESYKNYIKIEYI
ncbi:MAG: ribosomal-processing cysteine protease Prp [Bacilli bacterium]|jgi:uncharacterized protein YsxB (DUF464 family)